MRQKTQQEELMVRYLLGELPEEEQNRIEERFLNDNQYFEQLLAVEDALIDDYVCGELSERETDLLDKALSSSPHQLKELAFTKNLVSDLSATGRDVSEQPATSRAEHNRFGTLQALPRKRFFEKRSLIPAMSLMAALAVLTVIVLIWNLSLRSEIRQVTAERQAFEKKEQELQHRIEEQDRDREEMLKRLEDERQRRKQAEQDMIALQQSTADRSSIDTASIALSTDSILRGDGEWPTVFIRPGTRLVRIQLELEEGDNKKSLGVVIRAINGSQIWSKDAVRASPANSDKLILSIPASNFERGDYRLTLKEKTAARISTDLRDYAFRVRR